MTATTPSIRDVGRHAIRLNLARVAFDRFCLQGFSRVTFDELAEAAGVSRSTFLRHFHTKEDAVLFVFDPIGVEVAARLARGDALAAAVRDAVGAVEAQAPELRAVMDLIAETPELELGLAAKQVQWTRDALPAALAAAPDDDQVVVEARLAGASACVIVALRRWAAGAPRATLDSVLDRALSAVRS